MSPVNFLNETEMAIKVKTDRTFPSLILKQPGPGPIIIIFHKNSINSRVTEALAVPARYLFPRGRGGRRRLKNLVDTPLGGNGDCLLTIRVNGIGQGVL